MNLVSIFLILLSIIIVIFVSIKIIKRRYDYLRTLNLCFLKITLPKKDSELDTKKETTKDFKEAVSLMEQLYSSLKSLTSRKLSKRFF